MCAEVMSCRRCDATKSWKMIVLEGWEALRKSDHRQLRWSDVRRRLTNQVLPADVDSRAAAWTYKC